MNSALKNINSTFTIRYLWSNQFWYHLTTSISVLPHHLSQILPVTTKNLFREGVYIFILFCINSTFSNKYVLKVIEYSDMNYYKITITQLWHIHQSVNFCLRIRPLGSGWVSLKLTFTIFPSTK